MGEASRTVAQVAVSSFTVVLLVTCAAAQIPQFSNADLCNGSAGIDGQITGCTAIINAKDESSKVLALAHIGRGNALSGKGQYDLAIWDYGEAIKLDQNSTRAFNDRGVAQQKSGHYDLAIKDFDAAIKIDPNYFNAFANRAETYRIKGDYAAAIADFDKTITLRPKLAALWNERCWTRAIVGELQGALADCNEALRLEPSRAEALDSRGFTYLKLGQWDAAIGDFNSALQIDHLASALYGRGFAEVKKGDLRSGNADIAAAKAADRNIADEYDHYGLH